MFPKQIGRNKLMITYRGDDLHSALTSAREIGFPDIKKCGACNSDNLRLTAFTTEAEGYKYVKVICGDCRASLTMGQTKKDHIYYARKNDNGHPDWVAYVPKNQPQPTPQPSAQSEPEDDLPF